MPQDQVQDSTQGAGEASAEPTQSTSTGNQMPTSFEIDGEKYTPEDIREFKQGYLRMSDYTRKTQDLAAQRKEIEALKEQASRTEKPVTTPEDQFKRMQALNTLKEYGVATIEDVERIRTEERERATKEVQEIETRRLEAEAEKIVKSAVSNLEKRYEGIDGRPKFDGKAVARFMEDRGMGRNADTFEQDMDLAYKMMHYENLVDWEKKNVNRPSVAPTTPSGFSQVLEGNKEEIKTFGQAGKMLLDHWESLGN